MNKKTKKPETLGQDLIESMNEVLAHVRGETTLKMREYNPPTKVEVADIRKNLGLTQSKLATQKLFKKC